MGYENIDVGYMAIAFIILIGRIADGLTMAGKIIFFAFTGSLLCCCAFIFFICLRYCVRLALKKYRMWKQWKRRQRESGTRI